MAPTSDRQIGVLEGGTEHTVPTADLLRRLCVDALIRMHADEFALLPRNRRVFVHFNLETTTNQVGRRYALLPITRPGRKLDDGREMLPVVDPTRHRRGVCTQVMQRVSLDQVTAEQFAHSLPSIRTPEELADALLRHYASLVPDLDQAGVIAKGCALTRIVFDDGWQARRC